MGFYTTDTELIMDQIYKSWGKCRKWAYRTGNAQNYNQIIYTRTSKPLNSIKKKYNFF